MTTLRRNRWAISFADLSLLLLGFFILLQVDSRGKGQALDQIGGYFAQRAVVPPTAILQAELFVPDEAILTETGFARIADIARDAAKSGDRLILTSRGMPTATNRFDAWDMASARLGATARAAVRAGMPADRITIAMVELRNEDGANGAVILFNRVAAKR